MDHNSLPAFFDETLRDAVFGIGFLAIVLMLNVYFFMKILFWFTRKGEKDLNPRAERQMVRFMLAVLMMCVTQVGAILLWSAVLHLSGLIGTLRGATLFAGSCYTTLGIFNDDLPKGWESVAFYIAFSGLFSFAIATAAMISMLSTIGKKAYAEEFKK